ncbi:MAG: 2-phosphosulfolactate phosphatase [Anaerolineae bacterium]|nr:2-phosphosulfolactate phosphatase [Anaerolineae bacterium]
MKIQQVTGFECAGVKGLVVVIDVLRAFTTAAFAFVAGAKEIILVGGIDEAFTLRESMPEALLMGEDRGIFIPGFDYGNSPAALIGENLNGRSLIQRTTAGTQGVVNSINADQIMCSSFVVADATVRLIQSFNPEQVTFVNTGIRPETQGYGREDIACSDYITALLHNETPNPEPYLQKVIASREGISHALNEDEKADIQCAIDLDRFDFAMLVHKENGRYILKPITP